MSKKRPAKATTTRTKKYPRGAYVFVPDGRRADLLTAMALMPDEAFGYLLRMPLFDFPQLAKNGGFRPESREAFKNVQAAAEAFVAEQP